MKQMRLVLAILLAVLMLFGCSEPKLTETAPPTAESSETVEAPSQTEEPSKEPPQTENGPSGDESPSGGEDEPSLENLGKEALELSQVPPYAGEPFAVVLDNLPFFTEDVITSTAFERYADLDVLGRCGAALASCGKEIMPRPEEERGSISSIRPSGWVQAQYDIVSGKYLYNRCHLIGWQLSAENANKKNLITGTKYINIEGMLPFENMVADYIKETGNHVMYRITPHYKGTDLVATGVQMEAYSVEDGGEGICFNVFCYNVQPGIEIDYATGESALLVAPPVNAAPTTTTKAPAATLHFILNTNTKKAHRSTCSSAAKIADKNRKEYDGTTDSVEAMGYSLCKNCF